MEDKKNKIADTLVKSIGFILTATTIVIGIYQFNKGRQEVSDVEFNRIFWQKQNEVYAEVCNNAGAMAAHMDDPGTFEKEKRKFLSLYYGELILVEDSTVSKAMRELKSYAEILVLKDPNMVNIFKGKVIDLSVACKESSAVFKRTHLE